jgi:mRNA interferase MazF
MVKQYNIYWVNLNPTQGSEISKTRPCVVVSPDALNNHLRTVIVAPLTSTIKRYPFRVQCTINGKNGEIATDQIRTVDKRRLNISNPLGRLPLQEIINLQNVLNQMFCL